MKTNKDFKNEEAFKRELLLKQKLSKYGPIGKLIKN